MSYTKQIWQAGDEITSAKLNHLEDGINNVATKVANFPVEINNPQDGDILIYNATEQKWVSGSNSGGSGGGVLIVHEDNDSMLDKTWKQIRDASLIGPVMLVDDFLDDEYGEQISVRYLQEVNINGNEYQVAIGKIYYITDSENGYPVAQQQ